MNHPRQISEEEKDLYENIIIACAKAGVNVIKYTNIRENLGFKPEMALAIQILKAQNERKIALGKLKEDLKKL